jgi:hypothetical protein
MDAIRFRAPLASIASIVATLLPIGASWLPCVQPPPIQWNAKRTMRWDPFTKSWMQVGNDEPAAADVVDRLAVVTATPARRGHVGHGQPEGCPLDLAYTVVVEHEALRVAAVRVMRNQIADASVATCIVDHVRAVSTFASGVADVRREYFATLTLHDLAVRRLDEDAEQARELLAYKVQRLRLAAADAAAPCWPGGDRSEDIEVAYTLVVDREALRATDVRVVEDHLGNPTVRACVVGAIRDMSAFAEGMADLRRDYTVRISLHDLYVRNRLAAEP